MSMIRDDDFFCSLALDGDVVCIVKGRAGVVIDFQSGLGDRCSAVKQEELSHLPFVGFK